MLEDRVKTPSVVGYTCARSARFRQTFKNRSSISCFGPPTTRGTDIFCERPSPVRFASGIPCPRKTRYTTCKKIDHRRSVDVGGLLSCEEVGACTTLLGSLRGRSGTTWHTETILDDEFWYVIVPPHHTTPHHDSHVTTPHTHSRAFQQEMQEFDSKQSVSI